MSNQNIEFAIQRIKTNSHISEKDLKYLVNAWQMSNDKIKKDKIVEVIEMLKDYPRAVVQIWSFTNGEIQTEDILEKVLEIISHNKELIADVWFDTESRLQTKKILLNIMEKVKQNPVFVAEIWKYTPRILRLTSFEDICLVLNKGKKENYREFVYNYIGNVDFNKNNTPVIPEELKYIIFNPKDSEKIETLKTLEENLPEIIKNNEAIKRNIQLKKANSKINDDIEIRVNIEEVLKTYRILKKQEPRTISEMEIANNNISWKIGLDTKYTMNPETALKRSYELATKMDKVGLTKKYPEVSTKYKDSDIVLKVLHPQDKNAILMGFNTNCCFRPNGTADRYGENKYSLFQYCTTTPYGGILECGTINNSNNDFSQIYMGTPFLVSGNCIMFYSYETETRRTKQGGK